MNTRGFLPARLGVVRILEVALILISLNHYVTTAKASSNQQSQRNSGVPLQISNVSVDRAPFVGQVTTLSISISSTNNEPDVTFMMDTLES